MGSPGSECVSPRPAGTGLFIAVAMFLLFTGSRRLDGSEPFHHPPEPVTAPQPARTAPAALSLKVLTRAVPAFPIPDDVSLSRFYMDAPSDFRIPDPGAVPDSAAGNGAAPGNRFFPLRRPDRRISFRDEMLAPGDFDIRRMKAMIVPEPGRSGRYKGFFAAPTVWGVRIAPPVHVQSAPAMLAEAVTRYTGIDARADRHLNLTDRALFSTPFLYIAADEGFDLTPAESRRFGKYLRSGGFALLDTAAPQFEHDPGGTALKQALRDALGCHARFEPIPAGHPIYRCFFEFDGPPTGNETVILRTTSVGICDSRLNSMNPQLNHQVLFLEGVFLDNRLVAVYSAKGYGMRWSLKSDWVNAAPQLKFGVNLVVYALTREDGITARAMDGFRDFE